MKLDPTKGETTKDKVHSDYPTWMIAPIQIWPYYESPLELRMSQNGGDEDWVALVHPDLWEEQGYIHFLDEGGRFGCCCVEEYTLDNGWKVLIGCHS